MRPSLRLSSVWIVVAVAWLGFSAAVRGADADAEKREAAADSSDKSLLLGKQDIAKVPEKVRQRLQDGKYAEAVAAIDEALQVKDAPKDLLAYLKARALFLQQKYDDAIEVYEQLEREHAESVWARRAKFGRAVAYARKGDFRAAELIYREEAARLLSTDRKQEIAALYLEFADAFFKPKDEIQQKPDYAKALEFYTKALEVGPKADTRIEVELKVARCQQLLGKHQEAADLYRKFIKDHPKSAQDVEARFRLGEALLALGQQEEARRTWQDLLAAHADAQSPLIAQAAFNLSLTYGLPSPNSADALSLGVASLESFLKKYPDHKLAPLAHLRIAQSYVHAGRHADAVKAIEAFLAEKRYAEKEEVADARNLLGRALQLQKKFPEALAAWRDYLAKHPAHHAWNQVQQEIINTEYMLANEKSAQKQYDEARKLWTEFLAKYPLDPRSPRILFLFGLMNYEQEKWDAAIDDWRRLVSKYPGTNEASQGQFMIAATTETKLGKLEKALEEYRKVNWGSFATQARSAAARLTSKTLTIQTDRIFRSNETPKIKLTSRNIESVTVRIYKVDMEAYFRKTHQTSGVEGLDIALIDPDKTFEFKVSKYAEYQQLESAVEVPLPRPDEMDGKSLPPAGVMAVTVSSKTLEATTLVVQSDLDIITKSSRDEVFVFAQNMRTGKAWPDARLLISNGQAVFTEEKTGKDGVLQKSFKELKDAGNVRVFAAADGSVASNLIDLNGVGAAQALADKGYIYTDRPAYRAGQLVHLRGILRKASDDNYVIEKGKKYTVEVFDSRDRSVWQHEVKLSEYGTFHEHFLLPSTSPVGSYRVVVRDDDKQNFAGSFVVHQYQLDPVKLAVETDRKVFYRGEEIEGKIVVKFYYGAPLAGREVRYQLAGGRVHTATTNDQGEVKFKLPTREFRETQILPMTITLAERNLHVQQNFFLSTTGFALSVSSVRPVYVSGESFEATVKAVDAEGKPVAQKVTLHVLERTNVDGKVGEVEVAKHEMATDAKTGIARQTLKLEKGASYVLRAEATDRFENPISGQSVVQISDDKDRVRLRILAESHTLKVGDTAKVQLHWREEPALALVTFQGAKILDYKLVTLKQGANEFVIPVGAKLAPNFNLEVAVMTDAVAAAKTDKPEDKTPPLRFHSASSPFAVERNLKVELITRRKGDAKAPLQPGDDVELIVKTTDLQGMPVSADLSVAMVESSLLAMFGWNVGPADQFFQGNQRQSAMRMASSITFHYHPATKGIDKNLLAEEQRIELAAEEAKRLEQLTSETSSITINGTTVPGLRVRPSVDGPGSGRLMLGVGVNSDAGLVDAFSDPGSDKSSVPNDTELYWKSHLEEQDEGGGRLSASRSNQMSGQGYVVTKPTYGKDKKDRADYPYYSTRGPRDFLRGGGRVKQEGQFVDGTSKTALGYESGNGQVYEFEDDVNKDISHYTSLSGDEKLNDARFGNSAVVPNVTNFNTFWSQGRRDLVVVLNNGMQCNVALDFSTNGRFDAERASKEAEKLAAAGAVLVPQTDQQETGFWNPAVITNDQGEATLEIRLPEQSTAWKLMARGVTTETLAGEAESELVAKKDLFGELKLPPALTDGDDADIIVSVHNNLIEKGPITVTLKSTIGGRTVEDKKTIDVTKKGIEDVVFKTQIRRDGEGDANNKRDEADAAADSALFELTVVAGEAKDVARRTVAVNPYGVPVYATAGGMASSDTTVWVEPPADMPFADPRLQVIIGPTVEQSLLDVVFGNAPMCQLAAAHLGSGIDAATSDLLACLALQKLFAATRDAGSPQAQALDARIRSALGLLVSSQQDDGGWTWTGHGTGSHPFTSARAMWALAMARKAGYKLADVQFDRAKNFLNSQIAATAETDFESKAVLLHALSVAGSGDFTLANRLYRNRPALSNAALAYLTLAFAEMDRKPTAKELLEVLEKRNLDDTTMRRAAAHGCLPWSYSPVEVRALYAIALEQLTPEAEKTKETMDWLLAHRTGLRWSPEKATGPATLALARWFGRAKFAGEHYKLTIFVNDLQAKVLDIKADAGTAFTVDVPRRMLKEGKQRINFQLEGRGRYTFQAMLSGFVAADKLKNTTNNWQVRRHYEPAPLELDGEEIPRGFNILQGSYKEFRNPLTQLAVGRRGHVQLDIWRQNVPSDTPADQLEYLVVTEPIPSGAAVIESSIRGGFERFELGPGTITFYVGNRQYPGTIHYDVHGYLPGTYRAGPTIIRDSYRPDRLVVSSTKELTVLPLGGKSVDEYRLSPVELFELGKRLFAKQEWAKAGGHLDDLLAKWNVNPDTYKESARMLLDVRLETGPPAQVVRYFEIIKEKFPDLELTFDKITKVGAAYHEIGEYERSYLVFRATVESSFLRENGVAGFLEAQGEFLRSVDVMNRLLAEYPPEPYVAAATFALAQRVYAKAPEAANDVKLREQKITRVDLVQQARMMLENFLTVYPEDPASDQAAFSLANALLELRQYKPVIERATKFAERYKTSDFLDSFWYIVAYSHFALGEHEQALAMAQKVAEAKRIDKQTGREVESPNKWQAVYIMGQVFHSLGKAADAIKEYTRVAERFADAKQAIEYFTRQAISLAEVTTFKPGEAAELELKFRNVAAVDVKVYRIDLMKFSLLKRNLGGITQINLSGIRPLVEKELKLGDGKDYRDRTEKLPLPLKEEGAYLVVCRGGDLYASGLVLVSPLTVDVQEETASGRVRVTVKNVVKDSYLPNVHVKAIGSRNGEFVSGQTDLRGVFVGDNLTGTSTVIAQADGGRYAFFRGTQELGPPPEPANGQVADPKAANQAVQPPAAKPEAQLLDELQRGNKEIQQRQNDFLKGNYQQAPGGVRAKEAF